jgi:hypothetical protein
MRLLLVPYLAASLLAGGCATSTYQVSADELHRLAVIEPAARGQSVRIDQELSDPDHETPGDMRVDSATRIEIGGRGPVEIHPEGPPHLSGATGGGGKGGGGLHLSGGGGDGKGLAIAVLVAAALSLFIVAGIEGGRFDGDVELSPMHPLELFGKDGGYAVVPLADLDPQLAAWADHALVRSTDGPMHKLRTAPLWRNGWTYGLYVGANALHSHAGDTAFGTAFTVQLGYFPTQDLGILGSSSWSWRDNWVGQTLIAVRNTAEVQYLPLKVSDLHAGVYAGYGNSYQVEDGVSAPDLSSDVLVGGAMLQLKLHTRIALTGRLGVASVRGQQTSDVMVGLSVY